MAKKKAESTEPAAAAAAAPAPKKKAPAKAKKAAAPAKPAAAGAGGPRIDTNLAATNAAKMLVSKSKLGDPSAGNAPAKESGSFKQMKDALKKPGTTGLNAALGSTFGGNKSNLPAPNTRGPQQANSQTQGSFNKFTVPRRTGG